MNRRQYLDWARGVAVLLMIQTHALDAWTKLSARETVTYQTLIFIGGLAAPLFLFLAGVSLVLAAEKRRAVSGQAPSVRAMAVRGLQIFALAFLFRLQAFVVSPGGDVIDLLRVDILNVMGLSLAAAGLLWGVAPTAGGRMLMFAVAAAAVALAAPVVRTAGWVSALPTLAQWYIRPAGDQTVFTLFPWAGFLFAGVAWASWMAGAREPAGVRMRHAWTAAAGIGLVWAGIVVPSWPDIYAAPAGGSAAPAFFGLRTGALGAALAIFFWASTTGLARTRAAGVVERMGRASLFIYWIHVELVYGYASWFVHRRLDVPTTLLGAVLLMALLYRAIGLRDRLTNNWRKRGTPVAVST